MRRLSHALLALVMAATLTVAVAPAASAHAFTPGPHRDFSQAGWDIDFLYTAVSYSAPCYPAHLDVVRARRQFCPWCAWHLDEQQHCVTV